MCSLEAVLAHIGVLAVSTDSYSLVLESTRRVSAGAAGGRAREAGWRRNHWRRAAVLYSHSLTCGGLTCAQRRSDDAHRFRLAGALAGGGALALAPGAGQMAAQVAGPVRSGAEFGAGNVLMPRTGQPQYNTQPLPPGVNTDPYTSIANVYGPEGLARSGAMRKAIDDQAYGMDVLLPRNFAFREGVSKADFARQAAMKQIGQNIATRAAMLQNAQVAGINAGQQALQDAGRIMGQVYQYQ